MAMNKNFKNRWQFCVVRYPLTVSIMDDDEDILSPVQFYDYYPSFPNLGALIQQIRKDSTVTIKNFKYNYEIVPFKSYKHLSIPKTLH